MQLNAFQKQALRSSSKPSDRRLYVVSKGGVLKYVHALQRRGDEVYVHYLNSDKRLDEWLPDAACQELTEKPGKKRKRRRDVPYRAAESSVLRQLRGQHGGRQVDGPAIEEAPMTEEEYDLQHHKQITAHKNFEKVNFGKWQIKTWYFSPYPLIESEVEESIVLRGSPPSVTRPKIPGVARTTIRSHGRTSDLLAGGLSRARGAVERSTLWVCDHCLKYMADGVSWERHMKRCIRTHPPGKKVYQHGSLSIWEVDGVQDKLFCQNLSLFGKLLIDVKTLFFDCDNFLFYLLTDSSSSRDHLLGFFSKEKVSYDDYNLACIIVLPPYQRKGYGMLMIEFSYELSRRSGKVGTPERPLSDLGLLSYLSYWVSTLVRFLRRLLSVVPPENTQLVSRGTIDPTDIGSPLKNSSDYGFRLKKGRSKNDNAESLPVVPKSVMDATFFSSMRTIQTTANQDGSATSHVVVNCTLADLASATNLRVEDTAFALYECGLLDRRLGGEQMKEVMTITREMVDKVGQERKVHAMYLDPEHLLL